MTERDNGISFNCFLKMFISPEVPKAISWLPEPLLPDPSCCNRREGNEAIITNDSNGDDGRGNSMH